MTISDLRSPVSIALAALVLACAGGAAAQARMSDDAASRATPFAPTFEGLDEALRQRLTSADDAASRWMSGELETLDIAARVRDFGAAAARAPGEMLYTASLARACVPRTIPSLPECDARDAVAAFATRDGDNAVPWLLLAERARQRRLLSTVPENLERAAAAARFDDYAQRSAPMFASAVRALPGGAPPGVDAAAANRYVERAAGGMGAAVTALCGPKREVTGDAVAKACRRIAALMVERAPNAGDRALGASLAAANAPSDSARAAADVKSREIAVRRQRCAETFALLERVAAAPGTAAAGVQAAAAAWAIDRAARDEIAACERLGAALGVAPR